MSAAETGIEHRSAVVAGLVLAAGFSHRFGSDKRCFRLSTGQTLLGASLVLPCAQLEEVWVVLRPEDDSTALGVPGQVKVVRSGSAALGMGHSLANGIKVVSQVSSTSSVAVFLGDMPWISAETLGYLLALASPENIVVPTFQGQMGHPVIFGRNFWPALQGLTGDSGAKIVLTSNPHAVRYLPLNDPGILRDVDVGQAIK